MGIVVIGSSFVDIKGFPFEKYMSDGRNAGYIEYVHGGVARNVVEDIANAGYASTYLGIVDHTPLGADVVDHLYRCGVNTEYTLVRKDGMGTWLAVFNELGDVAGSISKRPNLMPLLDVLNKNGDEIFESADSVIIELDIEEEILNKVIDLKLKHNTKLFALVSNMSIALERINYLKANIRFSFLKTTFQLHKYQENRKQILHQHLNFLQRNLARRQYNELVFQPLREFYREFLIECAFKPPKKIFRKNFRKKITYYNNTKNRFKYQGINFTHF